MAMKRIAVIGLALPALFLAACSGSDSTPAAVSSSAAASTSAAPAPSSSSASPTTDGKADLQAANAKTQGAGSANVTTETLISFGNENRSVASTGVRDFANEMSAVDVTFNDGAAAKEIITKTYTYVQTADSKDSWYEVGVGEDTPSIVDGQTLLKVIPDLKNVKLDGTETLDGVPTTRYTATLAPELALAFSGLNSDERRKLSESVTDPQPSGLAYWVDDQGRIIRASHVASFTTSDSGSVGVAQNVKFSNFGVQADIKVPAKDKIAQQPEGQ